MQRLALSVAIALALAVGPPSAPTAASEASERIASRAGELQAELVALRRDLHRHPEPAGEEERTAAVVAQALVDRGLEVEREVGGHGVVAVLEGGRPGPVVAYRADMDAVRADEAGNRPDRSTVPGVAHLCGHDLHVAVGVGVASVLAALREELAGTVVFLFQPAEETLIGAEDMIRDGALRDPEPEAIFALHASPLPVGTFGCAPGHGLPGLQPFSITYRNVESPEDTSRAVEEIVRAVATVEPPVDAADFARYLAALETPGGGFLASFVHAGARSVEPEPGDQGRVRGFVRASGADATRGALMTIRQRLFGLPEGTRWEMVIDEPFPAMVNDPELTDEACATIRELLGDDAVRPIHASHPFNGEDFALYQERMPGAMLWLGVANPARGANGIPHAPDFDADEDAIGIATTAMASVLWEYLERRAPR